MFKDIDYEELEGNYILVDVRSENEYEEYTIPGAINIPILDNEERKEIGTVYVRESIEKAKRMGVDVGSKKLPMIYERIKELEKKYDKVVLFCARGGLRSSVLVTLLSSLGVKLYKLKGGYKGYRAFINKNLSIINSELEYIVIQGNTGVGKTEILKELERRGLDILDLEGCANHRGSLLGSVGIGKCNAQKKFESLVYHQLKNRKSNKVFVEGESKRIGNILIPDSIYSKMKQGERILTRADIDFRANTIMQEYTKYENAKEEIIKALDKLNRYISSENIGRYISMTRQGEYIEVAKDLMIKYYDPMYENGEKKYEYKLVVEVENIQKASDIIEEWIKN